MNFRSCSDQKRKWYLVIQHLLPARTITYAAEHGRPEHVPPVPKYVSGQGHSWGMSELPLGCG